MTWPAIVWRHRHALLLVFLFSLQLSLALASPRSRVVDWINACRIDDWTTECSIAGAARKPALPWCNDGARDRMSALMHAIQKHHPPSMRVVPATCFGTNVQLYYLPKRDEFLINPRIAHRDHETRWYECRGARVALHTALRVRHLDSYFNEVESTFHNIDALALECELSLLPE